MPEWAAALHQWALSIGMQDSVTSVEEIIDGEDSHGTGLLRTCFCIDVGKDHVHK